MQDDNTIASQFKGLLITGTIRIVDWISTVKLQNSELFLYE